MKSKSRIERIEKRLKVSNYCPVCGFGKPGPMSIIAHLGKPEKTLQPEFCPNCGRRLVFDATAAFDLPEGIPNA